MSLLYRLHTNIITCDWMRYVVVVESKLINDLKQSASSNDIWFLYHRHKQNHYDNRVSKLQREYIYSIFNSVLGNFQESTGS